MTIIRTDLLQRPGLAGLVRHSWRPFADGPFESFVAVEVEVVPVDQKGTGVRSLQTEKVS